ncbi:programmed cell death protein 2-like [Saccostrea echinata]|uniref:programmed cell death protein 2-like n=1 Tax=Saccostrea echinata TaxID=191078 RepID=UPI002A81E10F|nr:programmed cell death protein 2-like [Saccostrea echinata]
MAENSHVDLGFVEKTDTGKLSCQYFPSKVGGKPAWLSLSSLPSPNQILCSKCNNICVFLLQVYAPIEDDDNSFHRTVFVFLCKNPNCHQPNSSVPFIALRSQLPRINDFYSPDPPTPVTPVPDNGDKLCVVCGISGPKCCSKCHSRSYCSKEHQIIDWKKGHKLNCNECKEDKTTNTSQVLFQEYELLIEDEEFQKEEEKSEPEKKEELHSFLKSEKASSLLQDCSSEELEKMSNQSEDKVFLKFRKRIDHAPEQVLRYDRGGCPLLVSSDNKPDKIPNCTCGAQRQFEFQVMPQLLCHLGVDQVGDSIDWGTLCVYTCSANCYHGNQYQQEYLWKQDYSK